MTILMYDTLFNLRDIFGSNLSRISPKPYYFEFYDSILSTERILQFLNSSKNLMEC
jgi:hypothetical protein